MVNEGASYPPLAMVRHETAWACASAEFGYQVRGGPSLDDGGIYVVMGCSTG